MILLFIFQILHRVSINYGLQPIFFFFVIVFLPCVRRFSMFIGEQVLHRIQRLHEHCHDGKLTATASERWKARQGFVIRPDTFAKNTPSGTCTHCTLTTIPQPYIDVYYRLHETFSRVSCCRMSADLVVQCIVKNA